MTKYEEEHLELASITEGNCYSMSTTMARLSLVNAYLQPASLRFSCARWTGFQTLAQGTTNDLEKEFKKFISSLVAVGPCHLPGRNRNDTKNR